MCPSIPSAPVFLRSLYNIWHVFEFKRSSGDSTFSMLIFSFAFSHPFFSRIFSAFRSWLELSVGHRRPTHAGCSTVVTQLITWLRITLEWTFGRAAQFFCFFFSSVRCMEKLRNLSISGHSQHLLRRKRRSARREGTEREREEKDVTMQSAPSAQRLRCGLAPSSQSQPDPHIAFIYLWKRGERRACDGEWERETETGSGWQGRRGGWWCWWVDVCVWGGVKKKGKSKSFVFTHTESLPETLDHISDSLLSSLLTQSHVKDWWARWWTKINQSHSHSHRQTAREAGEQPGRPSSVSKTRPRFSLAKSRSLFFPSFSFFLFFPQWSFSSSLLPSFVSVMAALDCCFDHSIQRLAEKNLVVKLTIREQFKCWTHFLLSDLLTY